jgi:hypothetical protein
VQRPAAPGAAAFEDFIMDFLRHARPRLAGLSIGNPVLNWG